MVERGHDVVVYCRSSHCSSRLDSYRGMRLRYLPTIRHKHLETLTHTAFSALGLDRSSAVVCMGVGSAPVVRAVELRGKRCVFNVDGADWQREKWGRFAKWYLRRCERMAANSHSVLVADAEVLQQYYRQQYHRDTELVAYGAEAPADHGTGVLDHFGLRPDWYALFVGRLVPENGAHDFLAGEARGPDLVVGDAPFERQYIERLRAAAPPRTLFTGYQFGPSYQQLTAHDNHENREVPTSQRSRRVTSALERGSG
jgi:glycosyltransferase involved in cell wall biosynthesis